MNERSKSKLDEPRIGQFFESMNIAGSLMKDGSPHVTPTFVDIKNGNILVKTAIGRIKYKNV